MSELVGSAEDTRLLVARNINVTKWLASRMSDKTYVHASIEIEFDGDRLSNATLGNLYILKDKWDRAHQCVYFALLAIMYEFKNANEHMIMVSCGALRLVGRIRYADIMFLNRKREAIVLAEIDSMRRSLPNAHAFCMEYFGLMPGLRAMPLWSL